MMWLMFWRRNRKSNRCPQGRVHRRQERRLRPQLEALEDRTVLSSYNASSVRDLINDIKAADKAGGSNTIVLTAPVTTPYVLTAVDNTTNGANGLPAIASSKGVNLTIVGNGDIIERSTAAGTPAFRLFDLAAGSSLTLQNLTLENGLAFGSGTAADGGAIYNQGTLNLTGVTVQNNTAQGSNGANGVITEPTNKQSGSQNINGQAGADAAGGGIWSSGSVTLQSGTTLQGNSADGGNGGAAGAVGYNAFAVTGTYGNGGAGGGGFGGGLFETGGSVSAGNTAFVSNGASGGAGGGQQTDPPPEWLAGAPSSPPANTTGIGGRGSGGGLYVAGGTLALSTVIVQSNQARGGAGGQFYFYAAVAEPGGEASGGGIYVASGTVNLDMITLAANTAHGGAPGNEPDTMNSDWGYGGNALGGGLYVGGGTVTLTGSTVTGNQAWGGDGGGSGSYVLSVGGPGLGEGGGIFVNGAALTVSTSAFSLTNVSDPGTPNNITGPYTDGGGNTFS
jgi:hypothetical protein